MLRSLFVVTGIKEYFPQNFICEMSKYTFIDLFAGAGGLSEGFINAGFTPIAHVEIENSACNTLRTRTAYHYLKQSGQLDIYNNYLKNKISRKDLYKRIPKNLLQSVINKGISQENNSLIFNKIDAQLQPSQEVDFIIGGPPCQAYSLVGRARSENQMKRDPRNFLYVQYGEYLKKYKPKLFLFENVVGLKSAGNGQYLTNMERLFNSKGYKIHMFLVKAESFGVLQFRRRVIIIGWRDDFTPILPDLENYQGKHSGLVSDIFKDLPKLQSGEGIDKYCNYSGKATNYIKESKIRNGFNILTHHVARQHNDRDKEIYKIAVDKWNNGNERLNYNDLPERLKTHNNRTSFVDRYKVVGADLPASHTVVAHIAKDGHYYIHPDIEQNRSISVREAARLQSFPDDFFFEGVTERANRTAAFTQIGNAVPPLMARKIAEELKHLLH